jgi:glycosyltransferase involved in cell wall biosynthesis
MRILWLNLATDCDDPILGFATRWIDEVARRAQFVHVISMRVGRTLPRENVRIHSVGKEKGYGEARRALEFYAALVRVRREGPIDVCFAHMISVFAAMAAPVLKPQKVPIVLWYTHPTVTWLLKLAHHAVDRVVTSLPGSYPYRPDKVQVIGHGIDTEMFCPDPEVVLDDPPVILSVGRVSPYKDFGTLLEAAALLKARRQSRFRIVIVGSPVVATDHAYAESLQSRVERLGLSQTVSIIPTMPSQELAAWYRRATVCVNLTRSGSGDKVVFEAMSCGRICFVANAGFHDVLGRHTGELMFPYQDARALADRLEWGLSLGEDERSAIARHLGQRVRANHGVRHVAERLDGIFRAAIARRQR